jgi:hypothetical protein
LVFSPPFVRPIRGTLGSTSRPFSNAGSKPCGASSDRSRRSRRYSARFSRKPVLSSPGQRPQVAPPLP